MHQRKAMQAAILTCVLASIVTGCTHGKGAPGSPTPPGTTCHRGALIFDPGDFPLGTAYTAPSQIYNDHNGLAANIAPLADSAGAQHFNLGRIVDTALFPVGFEFFLSLNNTALVFDLKQNTRRAEFEYLDQGGFINLGARGGANLYIGSMYTMPRKMQINGVNMTKTKVKEFLNPNNVKVAERGLLRLEYSADIGTLIIGGQEMHVDNFCFN